MTRSEPVPGGADLEVVVERLAVGGDGMAREPEGRVVFVAGALPGERVRVRVTQRARDYWRAEVSEVLEAVPERVEPPCAEVSRGCGGCGWMHVDPAAQLELKVGMVRDALIRQGRLTDVGVVAAGTVAPLGYRTTARFAAGPSGRLGLRRSASNDVVEVDGCLVVHPALGEMIATVRIPPGSELTVRVSRHTGARTALLTAGGHPPGSRSRPRVATPRSAGPAQHSAIQGLPPDVRVGPDSSLVERVGGVDLRVSAASFFQSSPESAALLVGAVGRALVASGTAVRRWADLYGGVGLFAAALLPGSEVIVVEQSHSACADARHNLLNRNATVIESAVEEWVPAPHQLPLDAVVADPSRRGLGREGAEVVARTGAPTVVLVSCDAAALGRDAALLIERGYEHRGSEVLDLFPGTPHVEVVTRFGRSGP